MASRVGKVFLVLGVLVACALPVALIAHPVSYVPLLMVVALVVVSRAYLAVLARTFSYDEGSMIESCERGADVRLGVRLANASALPHARVDVTFYLGDLFGGVDARRSVSVPLGPRESGDFGFDARFTHLGRYTAGVEDVVLHDLLGLFETHVGQRVGRTVVVRPRLFDVGERGLEAAEVEDVRLLKPVASDNADYASVREYRYGDPLKTVHWNLSARSADGTLFTRLYETYVSPTLCIIVDPFSDSADSEELMCLFDGVMEAAASLSHLARLQGIECTLRYLDRSFEPATAQLASAEDADEFVLGARRMTSLAERPQQESIPMELLEAEGAAPRGAGNVAFATSRVDARAVEALTGIAARGRNPILLLALPGAMPAPERARMLGSLEGMAHAGVSSVVVESDELSTRVVGA